MPNPVTNAQFIMAAGFVASNAATWAAEIGSELMRHPERADQPMDREALARFRDRIMNHLDHATGN